MAAKRLAPQDRKTPLLTTLRQATRDKVERVADREGKSIADVARRAIEQYVADKTSK